MKIFLTGFMAAGKTTLGKELAALLGYAFIDLDALISHHEKNTVHGIFAAKGEAYFRDKEQEFLRDTKIAEHCVIAAGGGTPCFHGNMEWMNRNGITICLEQPAAVLAARLSEEKETRPLLKDVPSGDLEQYILQLLEERKACYRQAAIITPAQDAKMLLKLIRPLL